MGTYAWFPCPIAEIPDKVPLVSKIWGQPGTVNRLLYSDRLATVSPLHIAV